MDKITDRLTIQNQNKVKALYKLYQFYNLLGFYRMSKIYQLYKLYQIYKYFRKFKEYKVRNSNTKEMDATNEVISSLKFIGKLKKGDKINTKFMYTQPDGVWTRFSRTFINQDDPINNCKNNFWVFFYCFTSFHKRT